MDSVGIKELKRDASGVLRRVRENKETIEVTYRGKVVARIVPIENSEQTPKRKWEDDWEDMNELADRISKRWPKEVSAVDAVREQRQELALASLESLVEHIHENGASQRVEAHAHFENIRGDFTEDEWRCEAKVINTEGDRIAAAIGEHSTGPVSAVEIVREGRRDFGRVRD